MSFSNELGSNGPKENLKKLFNLDLSPFLNISQSVPFKIAAPCWNNLSLKVAEDI